MKSVKIGNDVRNIEIPVSRLGVPFSTWDELINLKLYAVERKRKNYSVVPSTVLKEEGQLVLYFESKDLTAIGVYDFLMTFSIVDPINPSGFQHKSISIENLFAIVETTAQEKDSGDEFTIDLNYAVDGHSYYQIWSQYYTGTEEDMIAWHRQPAVDAAAYANEKGAFAQQQGEQAEQKAEQASQAAGAATLATATLTGTVNSKLSQVDVALGNVDAAFVQIGHALQASSVATASANTAAEQTQQVKQDTLIVKGETQQVKQETEEVRQQTLAAKGETETATAAANQAANLATEKAEIATEKAELASTAATNADTARTNLTNAVNTKLNEVDVSENIRQNQESTRVANENTRIAAENARNISGNTYNVTIAIPLTAGQFYTSTTARAAVPTGVRKRGLILTYETSSGVWYSERFKGANISTWATESDWELVPSKKYVDDADAKKADLINGTVPAEQLPPELIDTTLYLTNVAHRKRRIQDASNVEDSTALWTLVKGSDYIKRLPDILGLGLYLVSQDLTSHKKLSKTNSNFYVDGTPAALDGSEGDIQMCWRRPIYIKYYEKQEADGLYEHLEISHLNILGDCEMMPAGGGFPAVLARDTLTLRALYSTSANYRGGNNASAYDADPLKTLLGKPASNLSAYTSELYAKKRGQLWTSGGSPFFATLAILQIMFFGTNNSQAAIVSDDALIDGVGFQRSKGATEGLFQGSFGVNNSFPNWDTYNGYNPTFDLSAGFVHGDITGRRVYHIPNWPTTGTTQTIQLAYFFGMPWPFNHMWYGDAHQRVDQQTLAQGFKTVVYQKRDITTVPISGGPSVNGVTPSDPWEKVAEAHRGNGYIRRVSFNALSLIPTAAAGAGGASTFYCDYFYNNGETSFGWRAPLRFADLTYGSASGAFVVFVNGAPTNADASLGAFCCHFLEGIAPRKVLK